MLLLPHRHEADVGKFLPPTLMVISIFDSFTESARTIIFPREVVFPGMTTSPMKVCYLDSMKLSLNLYGHKLPILSFDISSDNNLLISASADKNIKIWGMDFGDIHKSIFAH